jgi:hypothetical protein
MIQFTGGKFYPSGKGLWFFGFHGLYNHRFKKILMTVADKKLLMCSTKTGS